MTVPVDDARVQVGPGVELFYRVRRADSHRAVPVTVALLNTAKVKPGSARDADALFQARLTVRGADGNPCFAERSGEAVMRLLEDGIRPRDIMTRPAFENAITTVMALGGSTNAALHLLAIAHEAGVDLELEDFDRISRRTPHLGDLKPFGRYHMVDLTGLVACPSSSRHCWMRACSTATP